jgi:branched-chain amino acid transport system substrate-binding protein
MMKKLTLLVMSVLLLTQNGYADETSVKVGVLASLSGNWAEIGHNLQQGVTLAGEEVNAQGGVLGKKLSFDIQDTDEEKSGAKVVSAYRYLQQQGIKFFVGPTGVPGVMALTPLGAKDDMILLAPTSTNSFYKNSPKFFNAGGDNYITTKAVAGRAYAQGFRKVAIFGSLQPWENDQATIFKNEFSALGGSITAEEYPAADQTDLRIEALRIAQSKPDAVFFAIFNEIAIAAKALQQQGYNGGKFAAIIDNSHVTASNGALEGTQLYLFDPPGAAFKDKFKKRYGNAPGVFADSAYDAVSSLALAINSAQSLDREKVISALHSIKFTGSSGKAVTYDADGLLTRGISPHEIIGGTVVNKSDTGDTVQNRVIGSRPE